MANPTFGGRKTEKPAILVSTTPVENVLYSADAKASVVLGGDRTSNASSGYSGLGFDDSSAIDIVCGRGKTVSQEDKGISPVSINPDFFNDAARIYVSEKTDLDKNFGLVNGSIGKSVASSGIVIKADAVRIIGVAGIKIVTRANGSKSSSTFEPGVAGIELIAGNDDTHLQPMVKGNNLATCLEEMADIIADVKAQVHSIMSLLGDVLNEYQNHVHVPPSGPSATSKASFLIYSDEYARHVVEDNAINDKITNFILEYLQKPSHDKNILSPYNKTN